MEGRTPEAPLRTLRLDLAFDGTEFLGWQRQAGGRTVQAEVEAALARVLGAPHAVVAAGRTDAGAHARRMVASTRTWSALPAPRIARALAGVLPPDIGVHGVVDAPAGFHARRDARWKWYRYTVIPGRRASPLERRYAWVVPARLDAVALAAGAAALLGRHDFRSFANLGSPRRSTVRTLAAVAWSEEAERLHLDLVGDGFLYRMARSVAGTLVAIARAGAGAPPEERAARAAATVGVVLDARDRRAAGPAAPARGLCLMAVGVAGEVEVPADLPLFLRRAVESIARGPPGGPP